MLSRVFALFCFVVLCFVYYCITGFPLMQKALSVHFVDPEVVAEFTDAGKRATTMAGLEDF